VLFLSSCSTPTSSIQQPNPSEEVRLRPHQLVYDSETGEQWYADRVREDSVLSGVDSIKVGDSYEKVKTIWYGWIPKVQTTETQNGTSYIYDYNIDLDSGAHKDFVYYVTNSQITQIYTY
jgi:hypothetical protein